MSDLPYRKWSLIPRDPEPEQGRPTVINPPMMSTIALDGGASLVFTLDRAPMSAKLTATALTSDSRRGEFLQVYGGGVQGDFLRAPVTWGRVQDGMHVVFSASLSTAGTCVKLHLPKGPTLVVVKVEFEGP